MTRRARQLTSVPIDKLHNCKMYNSCLQPLSVGIICFIAKVDRNWCLQVKCLPLTKPQTRGIGFGIRDGWRLEKWQANSEVWKNGEEIFTGGWKNGNLCFIMAKRLAKVLPMVTWKMGGKYSESFCLAKEISRQSVESVSWVLLAL